MNITLDKKELKKGLKLIGDFFTSALIDETVGILVTVSGKKGNKGMLTSHAPAMYFSFPIKCTVADPGEVTLQYSYLKSIQFPGSGVTLSDGRSGRVVFQSDRLRGTLESVLSEDYTVEQLLPDKKLRKIPGDILKEGLAATSFAATSTEDLADIQISADGNFIAFQSNDAHRGAWWQTPMKSKKKFQFAIPREFSDRLIRALGESLVSIGVSPKQIVIQSDEWNLIHPGTTTKSTSSVFEYVSSLEGNTKDPVTTIEVDVGDLSSAISETISIIQEGDSNITLKFLPKKGSLIVIADTSTGSAKSKVKTKFRSKKISSIKVGGDYLNEFLDLTGCDKKERAIVHVWKKVILISTPSFRGVMATIVN